LKNGNNLIDCIKYGCLDKLYKVFACCLFVSVLVFFGSCNKEKGVSPAYLYIPSATLSTNYVDFGSDRAEITDVWIYVNDNVLGVFDLPALIPIIDTGMVKISMEAGVLENDFQSVRRPYPFFTFYNETIALSSLQTDTIVPVFNYKSDASLVFRNDFEGGNSLELREGFGSTYNLSSGNQAYEGARSGRVTLSGENAFFLLGAIDEFFLPQPISSTKLSYMELDYRNTSNFNLFLAGSEVINGQLVAFSELALSLPTQPDWNKIYINLSNAIRLHPNAQSFNIVFQANLTDSLGMAEYFFDNVKVIHE